ncbi:MAG: hypothetical protein AB7E05_07290 [Sphingobium sp.]
MSKNEATTPNADPSPSGSAAGTTETKPAGTPTGKPTGKPADNSRPAGGKALVGAAVGIGSAAIVAALLYARKRS